jgi:hypothetical protein
MARARGKPTPAKKRTRAGEGSSVREKIERALDEGRALPAKPRRPPAKPVKPRARPHGHDLKKNGARAPRSTKRSARVEPPPSAHPERARRKVRVQQSPRALSVDALARSEELYPPPATGFAPESHGHVMELHWGDDAPSSRRGAGLVARWIKRGDALLRHLAEHGAGRHEYRADLRDGRFIWIDPEGRVSAEARARVLCSWSRSTGALAMGWADPLVRAVAVGRLEGMAEERDDVDEESAWRIAMTAADQASAEYLYRVTTPLAWYFLALSDLTFRPARASWSPGTPVGLVLRGLADIHRAVESRAEPIDVVRDRLSGLGQALLLESEYAYRGTDWVARLERTGRRLVNLGQQLPRTSFKSLAAGRAAGEWLDRDATIALGDALTLLEDEWALFA